MKECGLHAGNVDGALGAAGVVAAGDIGLPLLVDDEAPVALELGLGRLAVARHQRRAARRGDRFQGARCGRERESLADLGNSYAMVRDMRAVPFGLEDIAQAGNDERVLAVGHGELGLGRAYVAGMQPVAVASGDLAKSGR